VKTLTADSNVSALAQQIQERCKYINASRIEALESVLHNMQFRLGGGGSGATTARAREAAEDRSEVRALGERRMRAEMHAYDDGGGAQYSGGGGGGGIGAAEEMIVSLDELDTYMEALYEEEMADKVRGTAKIVRLAQDPDSLDHIASHETLMGALARVLREETKRSMELTVNIVYVLWALSNFVQFHGVLAQHQAGLMCMKIIEHEIRRAKVMDAEVKDKKALAAKKHRQDRVLFVCFHVLLNLAQDLNVEVKMLRKGLIKMLCTMLPRRNEELLIVVVTFLKKLSIFKENKDALVEAGLVQQIPPLLPARDPIMQRVLVGLLLNLSFDAALRAQMVDAGLIPKLAGILNDVHHRPQILAVLYHLSQDEAACSMFCYTDAVPAVMRQLIELPHEAGATEALALAINLAHNARNAELMCAGDTLRALVDRAFRTRDPLLLKLVRNLSQHEDEALRMRFVDYIVDLVKLVRDCPDRSDVLVEAIGTLGNLVVDGFDHAKLTEDFRIIDLLHRHLSPGASDDDLVLECVIWCGTLLSDEDVPAMFAESPLIRDLFKVLQERTDDPEIMLQVTYVFQRLLCADETRAIVLEQTQVVYYLVDFVYNEGEATARLADQCLDMVAEHDAHWAAKIRQKKYEMHNAEWITSVEQEDDEWVGREEDSGSDGGGGGGGGGYARERAVYDLSQFDDDWNDEGWGIGEDAMIV
jgi:hypothetical protein